MSWRSSLCAKVTAIGVKLDGKMNNGIQWIFGVGILLICLVQAVLYGNYGPLAGWAIGFVLLFFAARYEKYRRAKYVEKMER